MAPVLHLLTALNPRSDDTRQPKPETDIRTALAVLGLGKGPTKLIAAKFAGATASQVTVANALAHLTSSVSKATKYVSLTWTAEWAQSDASAANSNIVHLTPSFGKESSFSLQLKLALAARPDASSAVDFAKTLLSIKQAPDIAEINVRLAAYETNELLQILVETPAALAKNKKSALWALRAAAIDSLYEEGINDPTIPAALVFLGLVMTLHPNIQREDKISIMIDLRMVGGEPDADILGGLDYRDLAKVGETVFNFPFAKTPVGDIFHINTDGTAWFAPDVRERLNGAAEKRRTTKARRLNTTVPLPGGGPPPAALHTLPKANPNPPAHPPLAAAGPKVSLSTVARPSVRPQTSATVALRNSLLNADPRPSTSTTTPSSRQLTSLQAALNASAAALLADPDSDDSRTRPHQSNSRQPLLSSSAASTTLIPALDPRISALATAAQAFLTPPVPPPTLDRHQQWAARGLLLTPESPGPTTNLGRFINNLADFKTVSDLREGAQSDS